MIEISNEAKLQTTLQIPVSKVELQSTYAVLFSDGVNIGTVPITPVGSIIVFDTAEQNINNLKWTTIFNKYKDKFNILANAKIPDSELVVVPATFGHIYVRNDEGKVVAYYKCVYDGADWDIYSAGEI